MSDEKTPEVVGPPSTKTNPELGARLAVEEGINPPAIAATAWRHPIGPELSASGGGRLLGALENRPPRMTILSLFSLMYKGQFDIHDKI